MNKALIATDPFAALSRFTLGFDDLFRDLEHVTLPVPSYPPYNLIREDNERYRIEVAVAGFTEDDLQVYLEHGRLTISTRPKDKSQERALSTEDETQALDGVDPGAYIHRGIAKRDFVLQFRLNENIEIESATLQHGLLVVQLATIQSDDDVKRIEIRSL